MVNDSYEEKDRLMPNLVDDAEVSGNSLAINLTAAVSFLSSGGQVFHHRFY